MSAVGQLSQFLVGTFPEVAANTVASDGCWLAKVLTRPSLLEKAPLWLHLGEALGVVQARGQLDVFRLRCHQAHPDKATHDHQQFDQRLLDCMTEACAFAWADGRLGPPTFAFDQPGHPDVLVPSGQWVEAKGIWNSDLDRSSLRRLAAAGRVEAGVVAEPDYDGLLRKFDSAFADALKKFGRCGPVAQFLFVTIIALDMEAQLDPHDSASDVLNAWAQDKRATNPETGVVVSYQFDWQAPFYEYLGVHTR